MILSNCIVKQNPKDNPIYPYAQSDYYFELTEEKFCGVCFNFGDIDVVEHNGNKKLFFDYNLLYVPDELYDIIVDGEIESVIGKILHEIIERGYYESDTK